MLLANIATAHHIYRRFPELALLRRHPPPKAKLVDELQELCDQLGIDIDLSSAGALHVCGSVFKILKTSRAHTNPKFPVSLIGCHNVCSFK